MNEWVNRLKQGRVSDLGRFSAYKVKKHVLCQLFLAALATQPG